MQTDEALISVQNLKTHFFLDEGTVRAVDGVSFDLGRGATLGVGGESGCGKTTTGLEMSLRERDRLARSAGAAK